MPGTRQTFGTGLLRRFRRVLRPYNAPPSPGVAVSGNHASRGASVNPFRIR